MHDIGAIANVKYCHILQ